jgi:AcrR family transcriptional regulator
MRMPFRAYRERIASGLGKPVLSSVATRSRRAATQRLSIPMQRKPPRRTRERILELSLRLFNDFGEPNVNTTIIAEEMNISPGNLYYHFKNKDDIINCIFQQFEREIDQLLTVPTNRKPNVEDAWLFLHLLFELIWKYRFLYRDLNNLLINNRTLELRFKTLLAQKTRMARWLCEGLAEQKELKATPPEIDALATNMVVVATYWLSYEYVLNPRRFSEPAVVGEALARGCYQVMALTAPYLEGNARRLFEKLAGEYLKG